MSESSQAIQEVAVKPSEKPLPPDSEFLHHSIRPGQKRNIGFSMFEDYFITYSDQDMNLLSNLWQEISTRPDSYQIYINELRSSILNETEITFISKAAAIVASLNGKQIGEGVANEKQLEELSRKRIKTYKNTEMDRVVTFGDIKGEGIFMCAEASVIGQALSSYLEGYHVASADVVSKADTDKSEGHEVNFLISNDGIRIILLDIAYGVVKEVGGKKLLIPYIALLNDDQIAEFENGQNVTIDGLGEKRTYRIGTPHTPPGTWKGHHLKPEGEIKKS